MPAPTRSTIALLGSCLLLYASSVTAQHEDHPDHTRLEKREGLGFVELLDATVQNAPGALAAPAREEQAAAWRAAGSSWLAGRPSLVYNLYDDRVLDDGGQQEYEWGLQLPLRRPGERSATQQQGERYTQQTSAWQTSLRWQLAGELRLRLADLDAAELALQMETEAAATAQELLQVTQQLFAAGAVPRLDLLQAESQSLTQQRQVLEAEAALVDAEREYAVLTGLALRPAQPVHETLSALTEVPDAHPWLQLLQAELGVAAGNVRQNEIANKGSPQLTLGTRRERGDRFTPYTDAVAISLSVPFGGKSYVSAQTSAARVQQADVEVQLHTARRELQRLLHEAEHALYVTRQELPLAQQQAALGEQRSTMARSAFAAGELTLQQVLVAVQEAARTQREWQLLLLREQHLIAEYNQTLGVLP